jgi:flavodoxin
MKALVIYDSFFGNTEQIAQAIGAALGPKEGVETLRVGDVTPEHLTGLSLLVVGSPTRQFNASPAIMNWLKSIPKNSLQGVRVAAFDTRFPQSEIEKTPILVFFVRLWGRAAWAANHISDGLKNKGGELAAPSEGFFVEGTEGPLAEGELERAADWAKRIAAAP